VRVCIAGATGNIGRPLVDRLADAGHEVVAVSRSGTGRADVHDALVDLEAGVPDGLTDGCDALFLLSGWTHQAALLDQAARSGVRRVVATSGVSAALDDDNPFTLLQRGTEEAVAAAGLPAVVLRLPALASNTARWELPHVREPYADRPVAVLHPADAADAAYAALLGDATGTERLSGPVALTARARLAELAEVLGRELTLDEVPEAELLADPSPWTRTQVALAARTDESVVTDAVPRLTGHPARTHRAWLEAHRDAF
jgi:uncharacterized protein YbjT (DUF2867 family)